VIAGINWVVQHRNDTGLNIRVLNLSFGTDSVQPADIDPLAYAVEVAWNAGIVVVAAGGNDGDVPGPLADPAYSPAVIAVGATDAMGTLSTKDDVVAPFAQHGTDARPVDVTAPGVSVLSLAVPGSFVDQNVATGKVGTRFQRASGTSQSTAVVSGLAALIISKYPTATPVVVKTLMKSNSEKLLDDVRSSNDDQNQARYVGAGTVNLKPLVKTDTSTVDSLTGTIVQPATTGTGIGTLETARGTFHVMIAGIALQGELDIFGNPFDSAAIAQVSTAQTSWTGGLWNGARWSGDGWAGARWTSATWTSNDWTGAAWSGARWTDAIWDGVRWSNGVWDGARWSGARWSGARWSGVRWSDAGWVGARWSGARWSGARWSDDSWS
jgi:serine protease AprX